MRTLALIFSAISFCGLLMLVNVEVYHFMPASAGPEGGMIDGALGLIFGGIASLVALLFAFSYFRRARTRFSRLLLQWCSVVLLGFILVVIHMIVDYGNAQEPNHVLWSEPDMTPWFAILSIVSPLSAA